MFSPGGSARRTYGFDLLSKATEVLSKAKGPAASQSAAASLIGISAMTLMKNLVQSSIAATAAVVPLGVPPPVDNLGHLLADGMALMSSLVKY